MLLNKVVLALLLISIPVSAQIFTANVSGLVTDPGGAAIPAANVTARNTGNSEARETKTTSEGRYTLSQLQPGNYEVTVEATGFRRSVARLTLQASQSAELNIPMTVGEVSTNVEVSATAATIDTQTANKSVTLTTKEVLDLPVNARDPLVLVHATAGVVAIRSGISTATTDQNHNRFSLNGGRDESSAILIDGVPATAVDWGGALAVPSIDATQEVQVVRNTFDAQYGKTMVEW